MTNTLIFEACYPRTLDALVARFAGAKGADIAAWTFDDAAHRRAAEQQLASLGVNAKFRSALKPLVHFFLEEVNRDGLVNVHITYPVHENAPANRFTLEAYPLAALIGDADLSLVAREDGEFHYEVSLTRDNGSTETFQVLAPNHVHTDAAGETSLSPTGWLIAPGERDGGALVTDYEQLFNRAMSAIIEHDWGTAEPYFEELNIRATYPAHDLWLDHDEEAISLLEALHEDFYFSCLEFFQKKSGRPLGDRGLRPGQIVPEIVFADGPATVRIETRPLCTIEAKGDDTDLDTAERPLFVSQIRAELDALGGDAFSASTRSGRSVDARYIGGRDVPVMISAGQHANETTGIVGALRAARILKKRPGARFTISPLENPDGYALHHRLRADNPRHMHHAARYTALGDDLEYRTPENAGASLFEKGIRFQAERLSGAQLHVNLHGYPSHEWIRPLSGYVPRNFGLWTLPKGFFFIMRYHPEWEERAERLIDKVTADVGKIPGLCEFNAAQVKLYERHAGEIGFRIINGFPCMITVDDRHTVPLTLITEHPDETVYGDKFIAGHTVQMQTVVSAYEIWQEISALS